MTEVCAHGHTWSEFHVGSRILRLHMNVSLDAFLCPPVGGCHLQGHLELAGALAWLSESPTRICSNI